MNEVPVFIVFCTKIQHSNDLCEFDEDSLLSDSDESGKVRAAVLEMIEQTREKFRFIRNIHVMQTNDWRKVAREEGIALRDLEKASSGNDVAEGDHVKFLDSALMDRFSKRNKKNIESIPEANAASETSRLSTKN